MPRTIELSDELVERLEAHLKEDQTVEEFIEELVGIYEQEGRFSDPGL
jgi:predicted CopG family antitoxin